MDGGNTLLKGKVAVITGAGRGIGRAAGILFASQGAMVVLVDIDRAGEIREYIANAKARGLRIIFYLGVLGPPEVRDNQDWTFRDSSEKSLGSPCVNSPFHNWYVDHVSVTNGEQMWI